MDPRTSGMSHRRQQIVGALANYKSPKRPQASITVAYMSITTIIMLAAERNHRTLTYCRPRAARWQFIRATDSWEPRHRRDLRHTKGGVDRSGIIVSITTLSGWWCWANNVFYSGSTPDTLRHSGVFIASLARSVQDWYSFMRLFYCITMIWFTYLRQHSRWIVNNLLSADRWRHAANNDVDVF